MARLKVAGRLPEASPPSSLVAEAVAENLKRLRTMRGISLAALARESGVARATLYQMENGVGNPTIETLFAVSMMLSAPLSELVMVTPPMQLIRAADGVWAGGSGVEVKLLRRFGVGHDAVELFDLRLNGGSVSSSHAHPEGVFEHVRLHSGQLLVGPAEGAVLLKPGDYVCFRADVEHVYRAVSGKVSASLIMEYPRHLGTIERPSYIDVLDRE